MQQRGYYPQAMDFSDWIQEQLAARGWDQAELARRMNMTSAQVSRVVTGGRGAGVDFSIALARALGVPREEVFRARGWLLRAPAETIHPGTDPRAALLAKAASALQPGERERLLDVWESALVAVVGSPIRVRATLSAAVEALTEGSEELSPQEEVRRLLDLLKRIAPEAYEEYARRAAWAEGTEGSLGDEP